MEDTMADSPRDELFPIRQLYEETKRDAYWPVPPLGDAVKCGICGVVLPFLLTPRGDLAARPVPRRAA